MLVPIGRGVNEWFCGVPCERYQKGAKTYQATVDETRGRNSAASLQDAQQCGYRRSFGTQGFVGGIYGAPARLDEWYSPFARDGQGEHQPALARGKGFEKTQDPALTAHSYERVRSGSVKRFSEARLVSSGCVPLREASCGQEGIRLHLEHLKAAACCRTAQWSLCIPAFPGQKNSADSLLRVIRHP